MRERDLRAWLRAGWRSSWGPLVWVEAARGGSVGAPDVWMPVAGQWMGVELKIGRAGGGSMKIRLRPSQARFHATATAPTIVLAACGDLIATCSGHDAVFANADRWSYVRNVEQLVLDVRRYL